MPSEILDSTVWSEIKFGKKEKEICVGVKEKKRMMPLPREISLSSSTEIYINSLSNNEFSLSHHPWQRKIHWNRLRSWAFSYDGQKKSKVIVTVSREDNTKVHFIMITEKFSPETQFETFRHEWIIFSHNNCVQNSITYRFI